MATAWEWAVANWFKADAVALARASRDAQADAQEQVIKVEDDAIFDSTATNISRMIAGWGIADPWRMRVGAQAFVGDDGGFTVTLSFQASPPVKRGDG